MNVINSDITESDEERQTLLQPNSHSQSGEGQGNGQNEVSTQTTRRFTTAQILTFISLGITTLLQNASFSILTPFFPVEAQDKGATQTEIGLIFGIYAFIAFAVSPLFGKFLPRIGAKFMFIAGLWIQSGCNVLFGVLDEIHSGKLFVIYCFVIRAVGSVGSAACGTANFAIIAAAFPDNIAQVIGYNEMFSGFGLMLGPPLGGLLFELGGYKLPFLALGGVCTLTVILNMILLPSYGATDKRTGSLKKFLSIPLIWPIAFAIAVSSGVLGFLDPTLAIYLKQFHVSPFEVGLLFLYGGAVYGLSAPLWGYLVDKKGITRIMLMMGFYLLGLAFLIMGPTPLFNVQPHIKYLLWGLPVFGIGLGCAIVPTFNDMLSSAKWYGLPEDMSTHSIVSGVFMSMFQLGNFIGPTVGSAVVQQIGFEWASTAVAGVCMFTTLLILVTDLWEHRCGNGRRPPPSGRVILSIIEGEEEEVLHPVSNTTTQNGGVKI